MAQTSFALVMLGIAAGVALLLGVVGIYGVISYVATQRTREIGIRMALGAAARDVSGLFLRHVLLLAATGIAVGIAVAAGVTRVMSTLFFGVSALDPATYIAVAAGPGRHGARGQLSASAPGGAGRSGQRASLRGVTAFETARSRPTGLSVQNLISTNPSATSAV